MKRLLPILLLALAVPSAARGDDALRVLPEQIDGAPAGAMMNRWLMDRAEQEFAEWRADYEKRDTPEEIAAYQKRMREFFLRQIGGLPERTPLNAKVTGAVKRDGYRVEKILFQSRPKHYVTAALFLPESDKYKAPYPGVLVVCGHSANGKAYEKYQTACALLALHGVAALIVDPISQGERHQILGPDGKPPVRSSTVQHSLIGLGSMLLGRNAAQFEIWDGMRGIDYLQSRPEIDPQRIGCMGNSGGGTQTAYLMALDDRIKAAAPCCYITSFDRLLKTIGPQDAEQDIHGQIAFGMDHADYLMMRAPTPILMCVATRDFFDIEGAWNSFRAAKRLYSRMGYAERVSLIEHDATHGYAQPLREASARWMLRWLADRDEPITEPKIQILSDVELQVTPQGQVMLLDGARSVFNLNMDENQRLSKERRRLWKKPQEALKQVRQIAGVRKLDELPKPRVTRDATVERDGLRLEKLILEPEEGILLPALLVRSNEKPPTGAVLYLDESGKSAAARAGGEVERLAREGYAVLAVDVRGVGETKPEKATWYNKRFGTDARDQMIAYLLGESYVGLRAEDMLVAARWLAAQEGLGEKPPRLVATGHLCTPALHAAALEPQLFGPVTLKRPLVSWTSLVETPLAADKLVQIVHGALRAYDLPDLAATLGDKLTLDDPRDAAGEPVGR
jgi:dienelactone hydrolase